MKKMFNKVIAAAMMMAITTAMPAMAGNRNHKHHDKKTTVVVVTNSPRGSHFDKVDKGLRISIATGITPTAQWSRPAHSESAVMKPTTMQWPRQSASTV